MFTNSMFKSGNPSSRQQQQDVAHSNAHQNQLSNPNRMYQDPFKPAKDRIRTTASNIITDVEGFKATLQNVITAYLTAIESEYLRFIGRRRALALQEKIASAQTIKEVILALKDTLTKGNEDKDSLKTFLLDAINLEFGQNQILTSMPRKISYTAILESILNATLNQLTHPICMTDFSEASKETSNLMTGGK